MMNLMESIFMPAGIGWDRRFFFPDRNVCFLEHWVL